MSDHEELESLVAGWVLGAVEAEEADAFRAHSEGCPICREATSRLGRAAAMLPLDVEEVEPPARLRERILASAAASRSTAELPVRLPALAQDRRPAPKPAFSSRPRGWVPRYAAAPLGALALAVGLGAADLAGPEAAP